MKSIQTRLFALLAVTTVVVSLAAGGSLAAYLRGLLLQEFDRSLGVRCYALESLVTQRADGSFDVDVNPSALPEWAHDPAAGFFVVTDPAGRVVAHSGVAVWPGTLPRTSTPADLPTPGGSRMRGMRARFSPQWEADQLTAVRPVGRVTTELTVAVARDRRSLDREQFRVSVAVATTMLLVVACVLLAAGWIVRAVFGSLRRLAAQAERIDVTRAERFEVRHLPSELFPIAGRLNDMLERVGVTLAREQRFAADVAHELRTPIAELRSAAEVALQMPSDPRVNRSALVQARDIAVQMQTLVTTLMAIVRGNACASTVVTRPTPLLPLVRRTVLRLDASDRQRTSLDVAEGLTVEADPDLLKAVLDNLIGNASQYGVDGTPIRIIASERDEITVLEIENAQSSLTSDDLRSVFEPFWRKDASRSDGEHVGIGLTLVQTYCRLMRVGITATLPTPGSFRVTLTLRSSPSSCGRLAVVNRPEVANV